MNKFKNKLINKLNRMTTKEIINAVKYNHQSLWNIIQEADKIAVSLRDAPPTSQSYLFGIQDNLCHQMIKTIRKRGDLRTDDHTKSY